jgi:hypothetical protein
MLVVFRSAFLAPVTNYGNRSETLALMNLWVGGTHNMVCIIVNFHYIPLFSETDVDEDRRRVLMENEVILVATLYALLFYSNFYLLYFFLS